MSKHFPRQVDHLKQHILHVGSVVEAAIAKAIDALVLRDEALGRQVMAEDSVIDAMEVDVEEECLKILALYQPVAVDLRFVVAVLKINNDLERMGDLARNIAKRACYLASHDPVEAAVDFRIMAAKAQEMVKQSLDALVNADTKLAQKVRNSDDELDAMRRESHEQILKAIIARPDQAETFLKLHSIAKHLERLGDLATNIAEDVIYMVQGEIVRHQEAD